jgi:hypothetical protein
MITAPELVLLRDALNGQQFPGIDTGVGNPMALSALALPSTLPTDPHAPIYFVPARNQVVVKAGAPPLNGFDLRGCVVTVWGSNAVISNCTFDDQSIYSASNSGMNIIQEKGASGLQVEDCTFAGTGAPVANVIFINGGYGQVNVSGCAFLKTPDHGIDLSWGSVTGCYFSQGGYRIGAHPDAISVLNTLGPVEISGNTIDWTNSPDQPVGEANNNAIRITTENGNNTLGVTVENNILLGGQWTTTAYATTINWPMDGTTKGAMGVMANVKFQHNYIGFGVWGAFNNAAPVGDATFNNNTILDWSNPMYSTNAWNTYYNNGHGLQTTNFVQSFGGAITGALNASTTLYGNGYIVGMHGTIKETVFVGGFGAQIMSGGAGANVFKYLAISDSSQIGGEDAISNFDPAKDVIDLSAIDANLTVGGTQNFTFIGNAAFSGSGGQVRYVQDPTHNQTLVQADLVGDSNPDLIIRLSGLVNLSAANFAMTSAQSTADVTAGANLGIVKTSSGTAIEYAYTNIQGRSYNSYQAFYTGSTTDVADDLNLTSSANELDLYGNNLTITRGSGTETFKVGTSSFSLGYHSNETIQVGAAGSEAFAFGSNFGNETINGFAASGTNPDTIQLATSSFSFLNPSMTQAAELAALLNPLNGGISTSGGNTTITDRSGDSLTLVGLTPSTIAANPSQFHFV